MKAAATADDPARLPELSHARLRDVLSLIREDYVVHGRDWARPGFRALAVYRLGVWRLTRTGLLRKALYFPFRACQRFVRNHYGIELAPTATIGRRVRLPHHGAIVIHEFARIGEGVEILQGCTVGAADEWAPDQAPVLEADVKLGAGAIVIGKVRVGYGARIGPNVVVTRDVAPRSVLFAPAPRRIEGPAGP